MLPDLKSFILAVAVTALVPASGGAQQPAASAPRSSDEQRCTGQAGVTPAAQVAACTALIDSKRFTRQNLAILHSNRGIADYDQALKLDPNLTAAFTNRALALRRSGNIDRAIADFDQAIKLNPKDVAAYNNRAIAF